MNDRLKTILEELYLVDPPLKDRETELIPLIEKLLKAKPNITPNTSFVKNLRKELVSTSMPTPVLNMSSPFFKQFTFAATGAMIALVIAIPVTYKIATGGNISPLISTSSGVKFADLDSNAFGRLTGNSGTGTESDAQTSSYAMGRGSGSAAAMPAADPAPYAIDGDAKMIAYPQTQYTYVYNGEISLEGISNTVYRKVDSLIANGGSLLTSKVGPVDLSAFPGSTLQNFSIKQTDKNGYSLYASEDGSVYISANEGLWVTTMATETTPLKESDMPTDATVIEAANAFVTKYRIDTSAFGAPVVDRRGVEQAVLYASSGMVQPYFPESLNVVYPIVLDGQNAMQNDGSPMGLAVSVGLRNNVVTSASVPSISRIERSTYELETDTNKILDVVKRGGLYNYYYGEGAEKTVEIELGAPETILMSHWNYADGKGENLFVPALKFPILNRPADYNFYQNSVIVPLPKDILAQSQEVPMYRIMEDQKAAE